MLNTKLYYLTFEFTVIFYVLLNAKKGIIKINESKDFLNKAYSKTTSRLKQNRIKTLLFLVEKKFHFQSDIVKKLGRTEKTIRDWLKLYCS